MSEKTEFYIVRARAVPEVLRGVAKANELLASGKARTVNEAAELAGISRSSYYKFKDDIEEFHDSMSGMNVTLSCEINDETGILASLLGIISGCNANILTIHQSIPINGIASLTISVETTDSTGDITTMMSDIEEKKGIHYVKVLAKE